MDALDAIRQTFFQECEEQLAELESGLLAMQDGDTDPETVNAVFRAVHSVKGGAGAFSLDALVRFAHVFETALDGVRAGRLQPDPALIALMLRATDVLVDLFRASRDEQPIDESLTHDIVVELEQLTSGGGGGGSEEIGDDDGMDFDFQPLQVEPLGFGAGEAEAGAGEWTVRFKPTADLYAKANETALLLRELGALGELDVTLDDSALPLLGDLEPEVSYLAWTCTLKTEAPESAIREVFEFVDGDCELEITRVGPPAAAPAEPAGEAANLDIMALISMAQTGAAPITVAPDPDPEEMARALNVPTPVEPVSPPSASAHPAAAPAAGGAEARKGDTAAAPATIRVDLERVDRLIDLVGELVINQAMLSQCVSDADLTRAAGTMSALDQLEQLTREIQDSVMAIRAQPVKSVFQRMPRLVREVAAMTGKQCRLVTEGEGTEVDKTVIERLADPLTHMIRNAIDHGLESPDKRVAAGKPAEGVVRLSALHRSGRIVIEIADDGAGINRERVKSIAVEKGLIAADAPLTDDEIDNLIFMPGFSTAETISDISGRGVGMDVVKRSIQALGGRISITSRPGRGSTFTMSLPLTLAVLDGMVVSVGSDTLVAPLTAIIETLQPKASDVHALGDGRVIAVRNLYVPLIDVGVALGYRSVPIDPTEGVALLIEGEGGTRAALLVDAIQGQRQVVIKSLEANYRHVPGIAAATILGDGRVALILDVDAVVACSRSGGEPAPRADFQIASVG